MSIPTSTLGRTGATVSKLGYGAMELRSDRLDPTPSTHSSTPYSTPAST